MPRPTLTAVSTLTTERLLLEPLTPAHADEMARVLADPTLHAYVGGRPRTGEELRALYEVQVRGRSPDGSALWFNWIVRDRASGDALGYVQATVDVASHVADVAWVIAPPYQGRRYAREAAAAMVSWLRNAGVTGVTAHVHPDNAASAAVARVIGLAPTAVVVDGEIRWQGSL